MNEDLIELTRLKRAIEKRSVDGVCEVWLLDWKALPRLEEESLIPFLDVTSLERLSRIVRQERRLQFVLARLILKLAVSSKTNVSPDRIIIQKNSGRPPEISADGWQFNDIFFSISHSRNFIGCAISCTKAIGLDIEVIDQERNIDEIARIAFQENERDWLLHQPADLKSYRFNLIWTRKESCYKLLSGRSRKQNLNSLYEINALDNGSFCWKSWMENNFVISICNVI